MSNIASRAIEIIAKTHNIDSSRISLESTFEELDITSMDAITIAFELEEAFGIHIPDDKVHSIRSVGEMVSGVESLLASDGGSARE